MAQFKYLQPPEPPESFTGGIQIEIQNIADRLITTAALYGFVVTIEQKPLQPLAMGNYESVVSVRPVNPNSKAK